MTSRKASAIVLALGVLAVPLFLLQHSSTGKQSEAKRQEIEAAIAQLSSEDPNDRFTAKSLLLECGPKAIDPLLTFLVGLVKEPYPRFSTGKEDEGARKLKSYHKKVATGERIDRDESRTLERLIITHRLRNDVISLLGQLRATEAVPLLIDIMSNEESNSAREHISPAMGALAEIGTSAVPALVEAIETSNTKNLDLNQAYPITGFSKTLDLFHIQARAAMVLGQIGDPRALLPLEKLLRETDNKFTVYYVKEAVENIMRKSRAHR